MKIPAVAPVVLPGLATAIADAEDRGASRKALPFDVVEKTIPEMRAAMEQGRVRSRDLVLPYLTRIALYEDKLNAAITVNPPCFRRWRTHSDRRITRTRWASLSPT